MKKSQRNVIRNFKTKKGGWGGHQTRLWLIEKTKRKKHRKEKPSVYAKHRNMGVTPQMIGDMFEIIVLLRLTVVRNFYFC